MHVPPALSRFSDLTWAHLSGLRMVVCRSAGSSQATRRLCGGMQR